MNLGCEDLDQRQCHKEKFQDCTSSAFHRWSQRQMAWPFFHQDCQIAKLKTNLKSIDRDPKESTNLESSYLQCLVDWRMHMVFHDLSINKYGQYFSSLVFKITKMPNSNLECMQFFRKKDTILQYFKHVKLILHRHIEHFKGPTIQSCST